MFNNLPGHNQSPVGILAFTSTRPYLNEKELTVRIRAAIAGLIVFPPPRWQPKNEGFVHLIKMVNKAINDVMIHFKMCLID